MTWHQIRHNIRAVLMVAGFVLFVAALIAGLADLGPTTYGPFALYAADAWFLAWALGD